MSLVRKFLREHGVAALVEQKKVIVKEYDDFLVLNYSMIDGDKTDPVTKECRGLIVHKDDFVIVCRPFDRFFNHGEGECPVVDFSKAEVCEKADGSLIKIWYNIVDKQWEIATRGTAFAESQVNDFGLTFRELFLRAAGMTETDFQYFAKQRLYPEVTYLLELACMENRVVTRYSGDVIVSLAARENGSGAYIVDLSGNELRFLEEAGARSVKKFPIGTIEGVTKAASELTGLQEGFVVYQDGVPVAKVKSPAYVVAHHIKGEGLSARRICQLVWTNEHGEYLSYFEEDRKHFTPWIDAFEALEGSILYTWVYAMDIKDQKEFALAVKDLPFAGIMFNLRKGLTLEDSLSKIHESKYVELLSHFKEK